MALRFAKRCLYDDSRRWCLQRHSDTAVQSTRELPPLLAGKLELLELLRTVPTLLLLDPRKTMMGRISDREDKALQERMGPRT